MKTVKSTFESLHDILSYRTYNISIDYKKKKILYNMNCYGNYTASKIRGELKTLEEIDSRFEKNIYISEGFLEHYFTSPTYKDEINQIFEKTIWGKYKVFCTKENEVRAGIDLTPVTREFIAHLVDVKKEKQKIERWYRDIKKLSYIPHVKLKHFDLKKLEKRNVTSSEAVTMIKNGQALEDIKRLFKADSYPIYLENYRDSINSLETIEKLESIGFKFDSRSKRYQELKVIKIFGGLGDNEESA